MAACARCGAQNPDSNTFCLQCGAPLNAASPPTPSASTPPASPTPAPTPTAPAPPVTSAAPVPPAFTPGQSAYLPPPTGAASSHRLSRNAIIAIAVVALLVIAGGGLAFVAAHGSTKNPTPAPVVFTPGPSSSAQPTSTPQPTTNPTPGPSGTANPNPGPSGGTTVDTPFATVFEPSGFTVAQQQDSAIILNAPDNAGFVGAAVITGGNFSSNDDLRQALLTADQQNDDPNAKFCQPTPQSGTLTGSGGSIPAEIFAICETITPQSGPAFQGVDAYVAGVATTSSGQEGCFLEVFAQQSNYQTFASNLPDAFFSQTVFKGAGPPSS